MKRRVKQVTCKLFEKAADAAYLCFDVGPLGKAHRHQDKLNINLYKGDEELIYDDGGGQYEISAMRDYALSGYAHNTVLVDGLAQNRMEPKVVSGEKRSVYKKCDSL